MIYRVQATFDETALPEFFRQLTDGSIAAQRPDGQEIIASMQRAVLIAPNRIQWSEMCFCSPPLHHERTTVYDHYLHDIRTEPISDYEIYEGESFWAYMAQRAGSHQP
jgi:hypothetical protein